MKGKKIEKQKVFLSIISFIIFISLLFFIPATLASDQIIVSFNPILNEPPSRPINPYPPNSTMNVEIPITLSVSVYDETGNTVDVYFYDASDDSLIGTDYNVTSDWSTASVTWSGLQQSTIYRWYTIVNDSEYENRTETWTFTTRSYGGGGGGYIPPINQIPIANITGPLIGYVNQTLIFSAHYSYDPDGIITHYRWDFENDGLFDIDWIEDILVTHTYSHPDNFTIKLHVKDNDGTTSTDSQIIIIKQLEPPLHLPIAKANGPYMSITNKNITFNSTGSYDPDGTIVNYTWDFGDKNISHMENPKHSYIKQGVYVVFLTVVDNDNLSNTAIASLYIRDPEEPEEEREQPLPILLGLLMIIIATLINYLLVSKRLRNNKKVKKSETIKKNKVTLKDIQNMTAEVDGALLEAKIAETEMDKLLSALEDKDKN
ncbi:MAG: PKD domain-containing protein [Thermoplasmatales archaeon]|nr:MAG: PKD domain-containing protein [Thermoplasmatales archaeon]